MAQIHTGSTQTVWMRKFAILALLVQVLERQLSHDKEAISLALQMALSRRDSVIVPNRRTIGSTPNIAKYSPT